MVRSFSKIARNYGFGQMAVEYNIGIMADKLMVIKDIVKSLKKLEGTMCLSMTGKVKGIYPLRFRSL